ncbi:SixA phosphatase family protein [Pleomorphovibrio marinus]|uniref:SixA phosphatase family protein n=1 Tax=Pleomorphovibrio marinus TaxID=2164132 RepID=UPI000E0AF7DB|nr:phosphoglycerate mutase family protein [Pleomorphovibrio marinus]
MEMITASSKKLIRKLFLGMFILSIFCFGACNLEPERNLYVVRHAEKLTNGDDPELAEEGKIRAENLRKILEDKDIRYVFSTPTIRNRATVAPLASAKGVEILEYDINNHDSLVEKIKSVEGDVLVVGHSNSIHHLANYFVGGGDKFEEIDDSDYEGIYVASINRNKAIRKTYRELMPN